MVAIFYMNPVGNQIHFQSMANDLNFVLLCKFKASLSTAQLPLVPNSHGRLENLSFFHRNHMQGTLDFISLGYCWFPSQFFLEHSSDIVQVRNPLVCNPVASYCLATHFFCLQCTVNGVKFEKLQKGSGKNVKSLEMFFSGFPKIIGMENFPSLQSLTLMGQQITMLENLECLPNLTELCVSESKLSVSQFLYDTVHCICPPLHGMSFQYSGHVQLRFRNPCTVFQSPQLHYGLTLSRARSQKIPYHTTAFSLIGGPSTCKKKYTLLEAPSLACIEMNSVYYDILKLKLKSVINANIF